MKIERLLIYCLLAGTSLLASCSGEEMTDNQAEILPEGMYPLTFTATQGEVVATPQSRVSDYDGTADGKHKSKWTDGDQIKVQIGSGTAGTYTLKADGTIKTANTAAYWQSTAMDQTITAWYPASAASNYLKNQSGALPYVLKATATANFNTKPSLPFAHKLAKFRFRLSGTAITQGVTPIVTVEGIANTTYTNGEIQAAFGAAAEDITPHTNGEYYEVLLLPGKVADNFIAITVPDIDGTYHYTPKATDNQTNLTLNVANCYTYDITVDKPGPKEINISEGDGDITIDKAGEYILTGSTTTRRITISANTTVTLKNASIILPDNSSGAPIQISGNVTTATLILEGTNTLTSNAGTYPAILPTEGSTVEIKGNGSLTAKGGYEAAGIGAGRGHHAGIVKILGGTITSTSGSAASGLGASRYGNCQGIEILGGTVTVRAEGMYDTPIIGKSINSTCSYIILNNCTINAFGSFSDWPTFGADNTTPSNLDDPEALKAAGVTVNRT